MSSNNGNTNQSSFGKYMKPLLDGLFKENPILVLMLGLCPVLAVTTSAKNAIGMGLASTVVLVASNFLISLLRKVIPDTVRMPAYIVIVASFVTVVDFMMEGFTTDLYVSLGIYIPLIVVNCIILGRAEAFASKNSIGPSVMDGIGMGLGFTIGLLLLGSFREILGAGSIFGVKIMPASFEPISIFVLAPGAFFVLAGLTAVQNKLSLKSATNKPEQNAGCGGCHGCDSIDSENK